MVFKDVVVSIVLHHKQAMNDSYYRKKRYFF